MIPNAVKAILLYEEIWKISILMKVQQTSGNIQSLQMLLLAAASLRKGLVTFFMSSKITYYKSCDLMTLVKSADVIGPPVNYYSQGLQLGTPGMTAQPSSVTTIQSSVLQANTSQTSVADNNQSKSMFSTVTPTLSMRPIEDLLQKESEKQDHPFDVMVTQIKRDLWWKKYKNVEFQPKIRIQRLRLWAANQHNHLSYTIPSQPPNPNTSEAMNTATPSKNLGTGPTSSIVTNMYNKNGKSPNLLSPKTFQLSSEEEVEIIDDNNKNKCLPIDLKSECHY